jgi:hypothetical protein
MIELRPLSLAQANRLVSQWHSHHRPVRGHKFSIGAFVDGAPVGAVIVGRPVAQALDDGVTFEVTRLVTNRTANAASRLLGAARRAAQAMGVRRMVSYTRVDETGHCYKATGWRPVASVKGRPWTGGNKSTRWLPGMYEPTTEIIDRVRWEVDLAA